MGFHWQNCYHIRFHGHGTFRLLFSGLQHRGWQRVCIMLLPFPVLNQNFRDLELIFCLLPCWLIVVGSLAGQWMGVMQKLGFVQNFWFGHQGYEYVDLGRFWQIFLFVGLIIWLLLMGRAILSSIKTKIGKQESS